MKKVVVISTSLRPGSNSNALAGKFAEGAKAAGHEVEFISLRGKDIKFCIGCFACQKTGACVFKDDAPAIMESVLNADVVCWATATEDEEHTPKRAESGLQGWIDCFEKATLKGHLFCGGVTAPQDINGNAKLEKAYELGESV